MAIRVLLLIRYQRSYGGMPPPSGIISCGRLAQSGERLPYK